jgi:methionyl-tRNA formyltransferase
VSAGRIVVFAYSDVGYECLRYLLDRGEKVAYCYTYSDPPDAGPWPPSVRRLCDERGVPTGIDFKWGNAAAVQHVRIQRPDLILSFYYRDLLPKEVLAMPPYGAFNMHGSLLPKYRGRAPVNWAVLEGETETGATLHAMVERADAGDIVDAERVPIGPDDTAFEVQQRVVAAAVRILGRQLEALKNGTAPRRRQNYAEGFTRGRRTPEDGAIDWNRTSRQVHDLVRAVTHPYPGAFTDIFGGRTFVWKTQIPGLSKHDAFPGQIFVEGGRLYVSCGDDRFVEILELQGPGEPEMTAAQWLATHSPKAR